MGGSSPGDGGAAKRRQQEERRVQDAVSEVNNVFGIYTPMDGAATGLKGILRNKQSAREKANKAAAPGIKAQRESLYETMANDAENMALADLNREREQTSRDNAFALARQGLTFGSRDIDSNKMIGDRFNEGVLQAANAGDTVANNARTSDEKTRTNLIASIRAGLDKGSAVQQAYQGLNNNINDARTAALGTNLTGFFSALQPALNNYQYQQGYNDTWNLLKPGSGQITPSGAVGKSASKGGYKGTVN